MKLSGINGAPEEPANHNPTAKKQVLFRKGDLPPFTQIAREGPLPMEEIAGRLDISQGSISQGLRQLEAFGAVVKEKPEGSRQALYSAKLEMKLLISGFLKERVIPRLESTESRVEEIRRALEADKHILDESFLETANHRLGRVAKWHRSARTILPLARKILGGG